MLAVLMVVQQMVEPDFHLNLVAMLFDLVLLLPLLVSNSPPDLQLADGVVAESVGLKSNCFIIILNRKITKWNLCLRHSEK